MSFPLGSLLLLPVSEIAHFLQLLRAPIERGPRHACAHRQPRDATARATARAGTAPGAGMAQTDAGADPPDPHTGEEQLCGRPGHLPAAGISPFPGRGAPTSHVTSLMTSQVASDDVTHDVTHVTPQPAAPQVRVSRAPSRTIPRKQPLFLPRSHQYPTQTLPRCPQLAHALSQPPLLAPRCPRSPSLTQGRRCCPQRGMKLQLRAPTTPCPSGTCGALPQSVAVPGPSPWRCRAPRVPRAGTPRGLLRAFPGILPAQPTPHPGEEPRGKKMKEY